MTSHLRILGIRGLPAVHGGFETFAQQLSLHLVGRGWDVTVYNQEQGDGPVSVSEWHGVRRVHIPVKRDDALGTVIFDWKAIGHCLREAREDRDNTLVLTLGYNTAAFNLRLRLAGIRQVMNMDGLEWKRQKWPRPVRVWFWLNERCGCWFADHLVADHPEIKRHLTTRVRADKITVASYGTELVADADTETLSPFGLLPFGYALVIARPEPENSVLEIVQAFSARRRNRMLAVLGRFRPETNAYHRRVMEAASDEVAFLGAIYEQDIVAALRLFCRLYIHGHQVGGTNPSLVEALGAGSPVLAYDNPFNRWVAGDQAALFSGAAQCADRLDALLEDDARLDAMRAASRARHAEAFQLNDIMGQHERLLLQHAPMPAPVPAAHG